MPESGRDYDITRISPPRDVRAQMWEEVRAGLGQVPKRLPSKYFYDARGSELFERITHLPEYYPTNSELEILERHSRDLIEAARPEELCELGSGSSRKTVLLIEAMHELGTGERYVAFDVSEDAIRGAADALRAGHPWLEVKGVVGDFEGQLEDIPRGGRRLVAFLGSTIGNLEPEERAAFLGHVRGMLQDGDRLLLGTDLVKPREVLEPAYDDAQGVTADFNRNVLRVLNRELGADFPAEDFEHVARWVPEKSRVEMHLRCLRELTVRFADAELEVALEAGEEIHTEISTKFTRDMVEAECGAAGLELERWETDSKGWFALSLLRGA